MARKYSSEYKNLQPYVVEDARSVARAVLTGLQNGGSTVGVTDHGALTGLSDDDHPQYLTPVRGDARYIPSTRTLTAGAGLTGGGDLSADRTFTVGAGYGITVNADDVALSSSVAGAGLTYTTGVLAVGTGAGLTVSADSVALTTPGTLDYSSTNVATGSHTHGITNSNNPGAAAAILSTSAAGLLTLYNGAFTQAATSATTFYSGFAGAGWRVDYGITTAGKATIETDDLTVRGRMRVYELLIQQIRATNGSLLVTSASKTVEVATSSNPLWTVNGTQLTLNGVNATLTFTLYTISTAQTTGATDSGTTDNRLYHGFLVGDVVRAQRVRWDGSQFAGVIRSDLEVTSVTNLYTYKAAFVAGDVPAVGYDYVRLGSTSDSSRRGTVYLTSDDSNAPFVDVVDGVQYHSDWNTAGKIRVRLGKLSGITGESVYGLWAGALSTTWISADGTNGFRVYNGSTPRLKIDTGGNLNLYNSAGAATITLDSGGNSYFSGVMTIGTSGEIRQGTGTVGTDYTGLRIWNDSSVGRIGGYNADTLQWYGATDGKLYFGNGKGWLGREGLNIIAPGVADMGVENYVGWATFQNTSVLSAYVAAGFAGASGNPSGQLYIAARSGASHTGKIILDAGDVTAGYDLTVAGEINTRQHTTTEKWSLDAADGTTLTLANAGVFQLSAAKAFSGLVAIVNTTDGGGALYMCSGAVVVKIADGSSVYSVTKDTASKTNLYYDGTNTEYRLQNNTGGGRTYSIFSIRLRAAN